MTMKKYLPILLTVFFLGCSDSKEKTEPEPVEDGKDRKAMLTHLADNIIIPSYDNFQGKFDAMVTKSNAFIAKPDAATLTDFRAAWADAYTEWQKVELFDFGPGEKHTIRNFFNIYPASEQGIGANIANPAASLETPDSYPRQGFPALDYLINGIGATDAAIVAQYTTAPGAAAKLAYIKRVTDRMDSILDKVTSEWKGAYKETFVTKTGLDIGSSTSLLVNGYVLHYERYIRSGKFGIPSGAMLNGIAAPEKVEAFYKKDISLALAKTAHQAYVDFFNGKSVKADGTGPSLKTYLDALGAKDSGTGKPLTELLNAQFDASKSKLNALKPNLYEEVKTNNQVMKDTYTEMQKAVRMLKVDMTSAMSITITYTDNDGD
ncbi:imelysin family protein [Dyadobacter sp. CY351]|uniref:imelysin family protein n=1 Tax=Dyadobacter sp. CY351 TaxID=2909337 RepID=UPI001F266395|nr:imelysin family protein [Dyadobacter sp. CY351]MCF2518616.1 imelysin family protein [Dyadobacter sp. CY351]